MDQGYEHHATTMGQAIASGPDTCALVSVMNSAVYKDTVTKPLEISYLKKVGALTVRNMLLSIGEANKPSLVAMRSPKEHPGFEDTVARHGIVVASASPEGIHKVISYHLETETGWGWGVGAAS